MDNKGKLKTIGVPGQGNNSRRLAWGMALLGSSMWTVTRPGGKWMQEIRLVPEGVK